MATSKDFIEYVYDQIQSAGDISYKKMFGEYMVYLNEKPIFLVCDDTVYVKTLPETTAEFLEKGLVPETGFPYKGAKEHYILDIEDSDLSVHMAKFLCKVLPAPKPKKKKQ